MEHEDKDMGGLNTYDVGTLAGLNGVGGIGGFGSHLGEQLTQAAVRQEGHQDAVRDTVLGVQGVIQSNKLEERITNLHLHNDHKFDRINDKICGVEKAVAAEGEKTRTLMYENTIAELRADKACCCVGDQIRSNAGNNVGNLDPVAIATLVSLLKGLTVAPAA